MFASGYDVSDNDLVAIARLRGRQLQTFDVPLSCISSFSDDDAHEYGVVGSDYNDDVSA